MQIRRELIVSWLSERRPRRAKLPQLQSGVNQLLTACSVAGISVSALFALPFEEIVSFTREHGLDLEDVRDICDALVQRLDELDLETAKIARLLTH